MSRQRADLLNSVSKLFSFHSSSRLLIGRQRRLSLMRDRYLPSLQRRSAGLLLAMMLLGTVFAVAQSSEFAALQITSYGPQTFDIATGITTLPEGGEVIVRESGTMMQGSYVRYQDGVFVEVRDAEVTGSFGSLRADQMTLDLEAQTLRAEGNLALMSDDLTVSGATLLIDLNSDMAVASGGVNSETPALSAARLLLDMQHDRALLLGPYQYADGPLVLSSDSTEDRLLLTWTYVDGTAETSGAEAEGAELEFTASTQLDEAALARFQPYLNAADAQ